MTLPSSSLSLPVAVPSAAVASPLSPLPLPAGLVSTVVSPAPSVPTPVPQPLATVVPIISVVTAPPDTPMEATPQVLVVDGQTNRVDVMSLFSMLAFVKVLIEGCCMTVDPGLFKSESGIFQL